MHNEEENGGLHWMLGTDGVWRELHTGTGEVREPLSRYIQELVDMRLINEAEYHHQQQRPEGTPIAWGETEEAPAGEAGAQVPAVPPLNEEQEEQLLAMGFDPVHQPDGTTHWRLRQHDLDTLRQELASRQEEEDPYSGYEDDDGYDEDDDPYVFPWDTDGVIDAGQLAGVYSYGTWRDNGNINSIHIENGHTPVADRVQVVLRNDQQQMYINIQPGSPDGRHIQEVVIERNGRRWVIPLKDDLTKPGLPDI